MAERIRRNAAEFVGYRRLEGPVPGLRSAGVGPPWALLRRRRRAVLSPPTRTLRALRLNPCAYVPGREKRLDKRIQRLRA